MIKSLLKGAAAKKAASWAWNKYQAKKRNKGTA